MDGFWFKSDYFELEKGEEVEANPFRYGNQLSRWLKTKLESIGYKGVEVIPEEMGWCVMFTNQPYRFLVNCGGKKHNEFNKTTKSAAKKEEIIWHCFIDAEIPFLKKIIKVVNTKQGKEQLYREIRNILSSEPGIEFVSAP